MLPPSSTSIYLPESLLRQSPNALAILKTPREEGPCEAVLPGLIELPSNRIVNTGVGALLHQQLPLRFLQVIQLCYTSVPTQTHPPVQSCPNKLRRGEEALTSLLIVSESINSTRNTRVGHNHKYPPKQTLRKTPRGRVPFARAGSGRRAQSNQHPGQAEPSPAQSTSSLSTGARSRTMTDTKGNWPIPSRKLIHSLYCATLH